MTGESAPGASPRRVVVLAGACESTWIVTNALAREFDDVALVLEKPVPTSQFLKRRMKSLGLVTVAGQMAFVATCLPLLRRAARDRLTTVRAAYSLDPSPPAVPTFRVDSINSDAARTELERLEPAVVVVNGTRIIGRKTLEAVARLRAPILNMHAGITPLYRGVHGGYWALHEGRRDLVGVTVHLVDAGIDTGEIIDQATVEVTPHDSFATYPLLQTAAGIPLLKTAVRRALDGSLVTRRSPSLPSRLRTHPTLWGYLTARIGRGVR